MSCQAPSEPLAPNPCDADSTALPSSTPSEAACQSNPNAPSIARKATSTSAYSVVDCPDSSPRSGEPFRQATQIPPFRLLHPQDTNVGATVCPLAHEADLDALAMPYRAAPHRARKIQVARSHENAIPSVPITREDVRRAGLDVLLALTNAHATGPNLPLDKAVMRSIPGRADITARRPQRIVHPTISNSAKSHDHKGGKDNGQEA